MGFEIVMESFNAANEQQLLVSGLKDTVALTLGSAVGERSSHAWWSS